MCVWLQEMFNLLRNQPLRKEANLEYEIISAAISSPNDESRLFV